MNNEPDIQFLLRDLIEELHNLGGLDEGLPDPSTPEGQATLEYFKNNWDEAQNGLLARTEVVRVTPLPGMGPRSFRYEFDCHYKRKRPDGMVELASGPVSGTIRYRPNIFTPDPGSRSIVVSVDSDQFYHPNFSRQHGILCIGNFPPGPFPLDSLIEHVYSIVSYQNMDSDDPFDAEAVRYFGTDPNALDGLSDVRPLY